MKRLRRWLIQYLVKNLLVAVSEDDVLVISSKDWLLQKRKLSTEEIIALKEEATSFSNSLLWKVMRNELRWKANQQMFDFQRKDEDMVFGKAMLYNLDQERIFINKIKSL